MTALDAKRGSLAQQVAAARIALAVSGAALWYWDLASGQVEWDGTLQPLFGYAEKATDAAWRKSRIHPEDRERVELSLQKATIVNDGGVWSDAYRFRRADGSYAAVTERAYVFHDGAGPSGVLGAITPTSTSAA